MDERTVSVVLALYNGEKYLAEQLESILAQTYRDLEVVIVDDGSTDGGLELANRFAERDPRVAVHRNATNLGLVRNFLTAVTHCHGAHICFSDQDDVWAPNKIETLLTLMRRSPDNRLVYSDLTLGKQGSFWRLSKLRPRRGRLWPESLFRNLSPGCAMMFTKDVGTMLGRAATDAAFGGERRLDDVVFMHDHLAFVFASFLGTVDYTEERLVRYRQHEANSIGAFYAAQTGRDRTIGAIEAQIVFLSRYLPVEDRGLRTLGEFVAALRRPAWLGSMRWSGFYSRMRRDTWSEQMLGIAEGLFPRTIQSLRRGRE